LPQEIFIEFQCSVDRRYGGFEHCQNSIGEDRLSDQGQWFCFSHRQRCGLTGFLNSLTTSGSFPVAADSIAYGRVSEEVEVGDEGVGPHSSRPDTRDSHISFPISLPVHSEPFRKNTHGNLAHRIGSFASKES
jgi:hypothetical protein